MRYFTDGLMRERNPFSLLPGRKLKYYMAFRNNADITLMWMEERSGGMTRSYPCLIRDGNQVLTFVQKADPQYASKNEALMSRWEELISPETVHSEYAVDTLNEKDFYARFREERSAKHSAELDGIDPNDNGDRMV